MAAVEQLKEWIEATEIQPPILLVGNNTQQYINDITTSYGNTLEIAALPDEDSTIKIKEVRSLLATIQQTAYTSRRLVIIPRAERLLVASANALLKELEETGEQNRLLLTTAFPGRLLPTIRSRCRTLLTPRASTAPADAETPQELPVFDPKRKSPLTAEEIHSIEMLLQTKLETVGPAPAVRRGLLRLRDYYKIKAVGGNERLAGDVLLASLADLQKT